MATKKVVKKASHVKAIKTVKKPTKKVVKKNKSASKSGDLAELRKLYTKLGKLHDERINLLAEIAKKESAISEVMDMNFAKIEESAQLPKDLRPVNPPPCFGPVPVSGIQPGVASALPPGAVAYRQ